MLIINIYHVIYAIYHIPYPVNSLHFIDNFNKDLSWADKILGDYVDHFINSRINIRLMFILKNL